MKAITSPSAPKAIGPYSQALETNGFIFISGQLPLEPNSGKIQGTSIEEQTEQVLKNIQGLLHSANLTLQHVVRCDVMLQNLQHFAAFNAIYAKFFSTNPAPARQTFQVAGLPLDALVEISCIAFRSS